ncbi:uncharacterized protein LOC129850360 isoform X1 [Salvelinus fontinalis]|uniref:uncharacterized protein LOC129850360 isoform X1 n=1 Tax=Salvelinus fontinalis TaxID=8038 RepID=UPI00248616E4|nr:uncharacterized protein LOC129850360 isoform X1 [Salvelinus fontinalis]
MSSLSNFSPAKEEGVCCMEKEALGLNIVVKKEEDITVKEEEEPFRMKKEEEEDIILKEEEEGVTVKEEKEPSVVEEKVKAFRMKREEEAISIKVEEDVLGVKEEDEGEEEETEDLINTGPCVRTTGHDDSLLSPVHLALLLFQFQLFCLRLWNPDLFTQRATCPRPAVFNSRDCRSGRDTLNDRL